MRGLARRALRRRLRWIGRGIHRRGAGRLLGGVGGGGECWFASRQMRRRLRRGWRALRYVNIRIAIFICSARVTADEESTAINRIDVPVGDNAPQEIVASRVGRAAARASVPCDGRFLVRRVRPCDEILVAAPHIAVPDLGHRSGRVHRRCERWGRSGRWSRRRGRGFRRLSGWRVRRCLSGFDRHVRGVCTARSRLRMLTSDGVTGRAGSGS